MNTWILLRGLTRETAHWGDFPGTLAHALHESQVVPLELPGNGTLRAMPSPTRVADMASFCHQEAARLGLRPPYHLLALSMGGMVAAAWASAHPDEIAALVMINTSFGSFSPLHHRLRPGAWATLARILVNPDAWRRERLIFELTSSLPQRSRESVLEAWTAIRLARPVHPLNVARQVFASARFRAPLSAPARALVLAGSGDRLVDPRCSRTIAQRWSCPLAIHPTAGHDLPLDDGPWVALQIRNWMSP